MREVQLTALQVMQSGPVIPVLVIEKVSQAVPLARALLAGGIKVLEVTLRTNCALDAIAQIAEQVPEAIIGAGTVISNHQFREVEAAGAKFVISPGVTDSLLRHAATREIPLIPGISTVSELMQGMDMGLTEFKFFPAEANGGVQAIKAVAGPFSAVRFCPTGGITPANARDYLALPNVVCVGGSWLATPQMLSEGDFDAIRQSAQHATNLKA
ncbi:bifunctional 4-hydroxy-2-oxoglutarate aldolase/2-dehydro-3-deoxy-phosphogluconate aldolase [Atlantibacter sp.]|uniref:bifunctional 4-hydroxy-2-oxoglutarate aldolase/2-dehydro-3-deoxy-phosphogluconate aldolase n=1 Tax=Atlantibacter sp. TaxID=1903473 RepID=UPI0028B0703F|nr:bifunctional 4-hydroxy-2-oxoglutarate aldolase/2-dehydro-3-deoxy-phosphogluconate aldolase [Atlantibacter sp.]